MPIKSSATGSLTSISGSSKSTSSGGSKGGATRGGAPAVRIGTRRGK